MAWNWKRWPWTKDAPRVIELSHGPLASMTRMQAEGVAASVASGLNRRIDNEQGN